MTYKEIVDKVGLICSQHLIIQDFGYGALTDIKTVADDGTQRVNYPYVFLNPTQSARTGQSITYRFNLIAMDVVEESQGYSNWLEAQSSCQQYIDDILAQLRFGKPLLDADLTLNVNLTPFKERFQDTVAGMTATLEIEVPSKLNECIVPIDEFTSLYVQSPVIQYLGGSNQDGDGNTGPNTPTNANGIVGLIEQSTNPGQTGWGVGTFSQVRVTFDMTYTWDPVPYSVANGNPYDMDPQNFWFLEPFGIDLGGPLQPDVIVGWPGNTPVVGDTYPIELIWNNVTVTTATLTIPFNKYTLPASPNPTQEFLNRTAQFKLENLELRTYA